MEKIKKILYFWPYLLLLLIIFTFAHPIFLKGYVPIAADSIMNLYHPYRDFFEQQYKHGMPYKNFLITDPMLQQYPWRKEAIRQMKDGTLPLWNPYAGFGEPLLANIQSASLYPLNIILFIFPFQIGWTILVILQMILGSIFLFIYLRHLKLHKFSAFIGSVVFIFSGFSIAWLTWNTLFHVAIWLPLILLSVDKIVYLINKSKKDSRKSLILYIILFIYSFVASFLAGHLQTFFYVLFITCAYIAGKIIIAKNYLKVSGTFLILFCLIVILSSIQWIPTFQLILESARDADQSVWRIKDGWFIPLRHLIQFLVPDFFGNPTTNNYFGTWNYGEMIGYVSILPLILAISALIFVRRKIIWFLCIVLLVGFIFSTENPLAALPFELQVPLLSTSQPTRLLFVIDFVLAVLASFGFEYLRKNIHNKKNIFIYTIIVLLFAFLWIGVLFKFFPFVKDYEVTKRNLILPTLIAISTIFSLYVSFFIKRKKIILYILIIITGFMVFDLMRFASKFTPFVDSTLLFPKTKTFNFLIKNTSANPYRVMGVDYVSNQKNILPPNISTAYRLQTIDTYNPLLLRSLQELFVISEWSDVNVPKVSLNRMTLFNKYTSKIIDMAGVKYIASLEDIRDEKLEYKTSEGTVRIYENKNAFSRAFIVYSTSLVSSKKETAEKILASDTSLLDTALVEKDLKLQAAGTGEVVIVNWKPNVIDLEVATDKKGLVVITNMYYPSWKAEIDGRLLPIEKVNFAFQGVVVPAGKHTIKLYATLF